MKEMAFNCGDEKKDCLAEVDLLQSLNHPNIVAFQESFSTRNTIYLIMEYCSGGDLAQYLKAQDNYLREVRIINWTLQILQALQVDCYCTCNKIVICHLFDGQSSLSLIICNI